MDKVINGIFIMTFVFLVGCIILLLVQNQSTGDRSLTELYLAPTPPDPIQRTKSAHEIRMNRFLEPEIIETD